jgi:4-amino-4-deoxy-L-arabinose transferase-like glycosyltransferase
MGSYLKHLSLKHQELLLLIGITTILRVLLAASIELGNDEVYYWTYVKYPDISHFDHPPMLGYLAQLFTLNLLWDSELALRLSAVVCGIIGTILIYLIAHKIRNKRAAIYAAILYSASLYSSIIASLFLMPDNPLVVFWLWSIYLMIALIEKRSLDTQKVLLLGIAMGFALLSKYQAIFLPLGFFIAVFFKRREWLIKPSFYFSFVLAAIIASPIFWWNLGNDFVSFGFHSNRVGFFDKGIRLDYFFSELFGQFFYNNPIVVVLVVVALVKLRKGKWKLKKKYRSLLLHLSWPLILSVLSLALFRRTLPHWTCPAYLSLLIVAAL